MIEKNLVTISQEWMTHSDKEKNLVTISQEWMTHSDKLTHWSPMVWYGIIELGQHWFRQRLPAIKHKAINWTNVDSSCGIHLMAISK